MIATTQKPATRLANPQAVAEALRLIVGPDAVTEVRCLEAWADDPRWAKTFSGYFDDFDQAAKAIGGLRGAKGVYFTLNPADPALLARSANRLKVQAKGAATSDNDIVRRRWLPIDCDALRPSGISASDAEHAAALQRVEKIAAWIRSLGWPEPIVADSGNGAHLLYRIDLPADDGGLVKRVLEALDERFSDPTVAVDTSVFNPSRIWKLYGTLACKGDSTATRPHRMASIVTAPAEPSVVSVEQLEALAALAESSAESFTKTRPAVNATTATGGGFDIDAFIARHGLAVDEPRTWQGGRLWTFRESPLCDHGGDGPFVAQHASGAIVAKWQHNSCGWGWRELREYFEPRAEHPSNRPMRYADPALADLDPSAPPVPVEPVEPAARWRPFPVEVLPDCLHDYALEVARVVQVDPVATALPGLVTAAAAIGAGRSIALNPDWTEPCIVWGALVAESGDGKTPAAKPMLTPARMADAAVEPENAERLARFEDDKRIHAADLEAWKKVRRDGSPEPPPRMPDPPVMLRHVVSDVTPERLAEVLTDNNRVLCDRDELSGMIGGMGRYGDGKGSAERALYLSMHSAEPIRVDRKTGERRTLRVESPHLSVYGGIQPALLHNVMSNDDVAAGLPARFLWAMPPARKQRYRPDRVREAAREAYEKAIATLYALAPAVDEFGGEHAVRVTLSAEAERLFTEAVNRLNDRRLGAAGPVRGALSKLRGYVGRLALVVHCLRDAEEDLPIGEEVTVDADSMQAAVTLADWFAGEAERVFGMRGESAEDQRSRDLIRWIEGRGGEVTERDVARGPRAYRPAGAAGIALQALVEAGHGSWRVESTATNQRRVFKLATAATATDSPEAAERDESVTDSRRRMGGRMSQPHYPPATPENMPMLAGLLADRGVELRVTAEGELRFRDGDKRLTQADRSTVRHYAEPLAAWLRDQQRRDHGPGP